MEQQQLKNIIEAVLMSAEKPLKVNEIEALFMGDSDMPTRDDIRTALGQLTEEFAERGFELKQVASGFRMQVRQDYAEWVGRLWEEKPARYSRALLETIALIAYRQPITRGEIEEVRGVSVSSNIIKTLMEREWIKVLGHKDVPGKPALYGTTKAFLDYFNLKSLDELPTLAEIKDLDRVHPELDLDVDHTGAAGDRGEHAATDDDAGAEDGEEGDNVTPLPVAVEAVQANAAGDDAVAADTGQAADNVRDMVAAAQGEDGAGAVQQDAGSDDTDKAERVKPVAAVADDNAAEAEYDEAEPQYAG